MASVIGEFRNSGYSKLVSYAFTEVDIDLLTYALQRLADTANYTSTKADAENLREFILKQKEEKKNGEN